MLVSLFMFTENGLRPVPDLLSTGLRRCFCMSHVNLMYITKPSQTTLKLAIRIILSFHSSQFKRVAQNALCQAVWCLISYQPCEVVKEIFRIWCFLWTCLAVFNLNVFHSKVILLFFLFFFILAMTKLIIDLVLHYNFPFWCWPYCITIQSLQTECVPFLLWCSNCLC